MNLTLSAGAAIFWCACVVALFAGRWALGATFFLLGFFLAAGMGHEPPARPPRRPRAPAAEGVPAGEQYKYN